MIRDLVFAYVYDAGHAQMALGTFKPPCLQVRRSGHRPGRRARLEEVRVDISREFSKAWGRRVRFARGIVNIDSGVGGPHRCLQLLAPPP